MNLSSTIRFSRSCPTCGRRIQIRASLLGTEIACGHCQATFIASANEDQPGSVDDAQRLMDRVERMLLKSELNTTLPGETSMV